MKLPCNLEVSSWHTFVPFRDVSTKQTPVDILPQLPGEQALCALTVWAPPNVPILLTPTTVRDCSLRTQHTKAPSGKEPASPEFRGNQAPHGDSVPDHRWWMSTSDNLKSWIANPTLFLKIHQLYSASEGSCTITWCYCHGEHTKLSAQYSNTLELWPKRSTFSKPPKFWQSCPKWTSFPWPQSSTFHPRHPLLQIFTQPGPSWGCR